MNLKNVNLNNAVGFDNNLNSAIWDTTRHKVGLFLNKELRCIEIKNDKNDVIAIPLENVKQFRYDESIATPGPRGKASKRTAEIKVIDAI